MMLAKGWARRRAAAQPDGQVVVDMFATELEGETEHGVYLVQRVGEGWSAKFRARDLRLDQRSLAIDALTGDGEHIDWPSRGCACAAVNLHARLVLLGYGVTRAAELVAQRSQRVAGEPETLSYERAVAR